MVEKCRELAKANAELQIANDNLNEELSFMQEAESPKQAGQRSTLLAQQKQIDALKVVSANWMEKHRALVAENKILKRELWEFRSKQRQQAQAPARPQAPARAQAPQSGRLF